jgi:hypothetical protein
VHIRQDHKRGDAGDDGRKYFPARRSSRFVSLRVSRTVKGMAWSAVMQRHGDLLFLGNTTLDGEFRRKREDGFDGRKCEKISDPASAGSSTRGAQ